MIGRLCSMWNCEVQMDTLQMFQNELRIQQDKIFKFDSYQVRIHQRRDRLQFDFLETIWLLELHKRQMNGRSIATHTNTIQEWEKYIKIEFCFLRIQLLDNIIFELDDSQYEDGRSTAQTHDSVDKWLNWLLKTKLLHKQQCNHISTAQNQNSDYKKKAHITCAFSYFQYCALIQFRYLFLSASV